MAMKRMNRFQRRALALAIGAALGLGVTGSVWSATAGQIQFVNGEVSIQRGATTLSAKRGDFVQEGDQIQSGADGFAQLRMSDDAFVTVRRDTTLKIDRYQYTGAEGRKSNESDGAVLSLVKGTFRSFTGALARVNKKSYVMQTPTATIGIRGTGNITSTNGISTENYTVTGSHTITTSDPSGKVSTFITSPNQNVVVQNGTVQLAPPSVNITSAAGGHSGGGPAAPAPGGTGGSGAPGDGQEGGVKPVSGTPVAGTAMTSASTDTTAAAGAAVAAAAGTGTGAGAAGGSAGPAVITGCNTASDPSCGTALNLSSQTAQTGSTTAPISSVSALSLYTPQTSGAVVYGVGQSGYSFFNWWSFSAIASNVRRDAGGNLTGWTDSSNSSHASAATVDFIGPSILEARTHAGAFARTGIEYGRFSGSAVNITYPPDPLQSMPLSPAGVHWITSTNPSPPYLPEVLTGTATYLLDGGTRPTDGTGAAGTLNSATLSANFTNQAVNATVNATVSGNTWVGTGTNIPLQGEYFMGCGGTSCGPDPAQTGYNTVAVTRNAGAANGIIQGRFAGSNADGAMLSYAFSDNSTMPLPLSVGGVAAFVNNGSNADPGVVLTGLVGGYDANGQPVFFENDMVTANNPTRIATDAAGNVTAFDARTGYVGGASPTGPVLVGSGMPVRIAVSGASSDNGIDATSGVKWGRYDNYSVTARPDGAVLPVSGPLHFLVGPAGIPTMPQTGTFAYSLVGNTLPTNDTGGIGTLNSATLNADFSAKTVSVNLNTTVAGTTLNGVANNMPIDVIMFHAGPNSTAPMTVTCSGNCGTAHTGGLGGTFVGTAAQAAALGYRMATSATASTVNSANGVAVFRR